MKLAYLLRENFTNQFGETSAHIISEVFRQFPVAFGLQKDSIFTKKFGEIIRYMNIALTLHSKKYARFTFRNLNEGGFIGYWKDTEMDKVCSCSSNSISIF